MTRGTPAAKAGAGDQRVLDVGLDRVLIVQRCGNPPCARLLELSSTPRLVTSATLLCSARRSANDWPARPLPMMRTSKECTGARQMNEV
jgi:hypothetical protein